MSKTVSVKSKSGNSKTSGGLPSGQLLDSLGAFQQSNQYSYELHEILQAKGLEPTMKSFELIAGELSKLANQKPPWTKKYIHSVYHCKIEPSPALGKAIDTLAQVIDGAPVGVAGSRYIKVLASEDIPEGVLIKRTLKAKHCRGCSVVFVGMGEFHDPECRKEFWKRVKKSNKKE